MDVLPDLPTLLQFALATLIIAITPGPDMTLFVGRALSQGREAGLACMAGAMTGCLIHTSMAALGLSALILASPQAFLGLKLVGAGYLLWLAYRSLTRGSAFAPQVNSVNKSLFQNWLMGIGINLLNPKIILFFMTFLPQFVSVGDPHATSKLFMLGAMFIPLSLPVTIPMVLAAHRLAGLLRTKPRVIRLVDYLFAGVFSAFALRILTTQVR